MLLPILQARNLSSPALAQGEIPLPRKNRPNFRSNQFIDGGDALSMYLIYLVVHEVMDFYVQKVSSGDCTVYE